MLILQPRGIPDDGADLEGEMPAGSLAFSEEGARLDGPVRYRLRAESAGGDLLVRGEIETEAALVCDRCAEPFRLPMRLGRFVAVVDGGMGADEVDLTPLIREDMILALPHKTLCREDCRGLCPLCGMNLNLGQCDCSPDAGDSPWKALDALDL